MARVVSTAVSAAPVAPTGAPRQLSAMPPVIELAPLGDVGHELRQLVDVAGREGLLLADGEVVEVEASGHVGVVEHREHGVAIRVAGAESLVALDLGHGIDSTRCPQSR